MSWCNCHIFTLCLRPKRYTRCNQTVALSRFVCFDCGLLRNATVNLDLLPFPSKMSAENDQALCCTCKSSFNTQTVTIQSIGWHITRVGLDLNFEFWIWIRSRVIDKFEFEFDFCKINEFEFSFFKVNEFEFKNCKKWMDPTLLKSCYVYSHNVT